MTDIQEIISRATLNGIVLVWRGVLRLDRIWLAAGKALVFVWILLCMVLDRLFPSNSDNPCQGCAGLGSCRTLCDDRKEWNARRRQ